MLVYLQVKFHVCIEDLVATPIVYKCTAPNSRLWNFQCDTSGFEHQKCRSHIAQKNLEAFRKWMRHETFQDSSLLCWANIIVAVWSCITLSVWFKETSICWTKTQKIEPRLQILSWMRCMHNSCKLIRCCLPIKNLLLLNKGPWSDGETHISETWNLHRFHRVSLTCCKQAVSRCLMSRHCMAESGE